MSLSLGTADLIFRQALVVFLEPQRKSLMFVLRNRLCLIATTLLVGIAVSPRVHGDTPGFLKIFQRAESTNASEPVMLSEEDGPWMILAAHFRGRRLQEPSRKIDGRDSSRTSSAGFYVPRKI